MQQEEMSIVFMLHFLFTMIQHLLKFGYKIFPEKIQENIYISL